MHMARGSVKAPPTGPTRRRPSAATQRPPASPLRPQSEPPLIVPFLIALGLGLLTLAVFSPVLRCGFVSFDDNGYVTSNLFVQHGLTWTGIRWAFTNTPLDLWHPLSFISLMIDVELFGIEPAEMHAVNALYHAASVILLFLLLRRMSGSDWRSGLAAALFAIHPLRVESVAWIAERKDVLAMFLGLLGIAAYLRYVSAVRTGAKLAWFGLMMLLVGLSLLSKPMFVTAPLLLLTLDFWPLKRLTSGRKFVLAGLEKAPLLALCLGVIVAAQHFARLHPPRMSDAIVQTIVQRQENAVVCTLRYLEKMLRVDDLALLYPIRQTPMWQVALSAAALVAISAAVVAFWRSRPWLAAGWAWFLIALLPVIGVVRQVGFQAMADRYSYLPSIGIVMALVWSIPAAWFEKPALRLRLGLAAGAVLIVLASFTIRQIGFWTDSVTLFTRTLAVTGPNDFAEYSLGGAYWMERHDLNSSIDHFNKALALRPDLSAAHNNLGLVLLSQKHPDLAIPHFALAVKLTPDSFEAQDNWGYALVARGDPAAAVAHFRQAIALSPFYLPARVNLGYSLTRIGRYDEAIAVYRAALREFPGQPDLQEGLARAEAGRRRPAPVGPLESGNSDPASNR